MKLLRSLLRMSAFPVVNAALCLMAAESAGQLEGVVTTSDGQPVANAFVTIYSATAREGGNAVCPTCHPECGRSTRTDAQGMFNLTNVNTSLMYRLLVSASGYRTDYIRDADPQFGGASLRLKPARVRFTKPEHRVIGKLIDTQGRAVVGGRLQVEGTRYAQYSYSSSTTGKVEPLAVTDENGEFIFDCTNDVKAVNVVIDARGTARRKLWIETGKAHLLRMSEGATVTGRLLNGGKPVPNAALTMSTQERRSEEFMRGFDATTDDQGKFRMVNVPANTPFFLNGKMKEMQDLGIALKPHPLTTGASGATNDLGDLEAGRSHTVRGRVVRADGGLIPDRTRVYLSLENAWDSQDTLVDSDGWFEFFGVPADELSISLRIAGHRLSARNPNKDWLNEGRLVGRLEGDLNDFIIHVERGDRFDRNEGPASGERQPRGKPLQGAKL